MTVATAQHTARAGGEAPPRGRLESPARLWVLLLAAVLAVLLAGSVGAAGLSARESTAEHTAQATEALYSEVQDLSYSLADANATAATALLIGPVTPDAFTSRFGSDVTQVEDLLSAASQQVTGDQAASKELRLLAEQVPQYAQWIGQALANNRFGYPVAGAYLRQASTMLTMEMLPEVSAVMTEQQTATQDGMSSASGTDWVMVAVCVLALIVLMVVGSSIARRTKRRVNPGVLVAKLAVLVLFGWTCAAALGSSGAVGDARADFGYVMDAQSGGSQLALSEAYVALQQIDRGEDNKSDETSAQKALGKLSDLGAVEYPDAGKIFVARDVGKMIACDRTAIAQAAAGHYQDAIKLTVGGGDAVGQGGCEPSAVTVRQDLVNLTKQAQQRYDADMARVRSSYAGAGALVLPLVLGLLGALAAAWGINRRLAEYR